MQSNQNNKYASILSVATEVNKTKLKNMHSKDKNEVTCKKYKFILEERRLLNLRNKIEDEIIVSEFRNKKGKI